MSRQLFFSLLITVLCGFLVYLGAPAGIMICGGGPCVIIINEGGLFYGAIEGAESEGGSLVSGLGRALARLKAAVQTSCTLVNYGSLYGAIEESELESPVLQKIIEFHKKGTAHFRGTNNSSNVAGYDVAAEAEKIEKYNRRLANVIAGEPVYPE